MKLAVLLSAVLLLSLASAPAAIFTVSTTNDSGPGSLRQAILDANGTNCDDTISFAVTGTITLASALPAITGNTTISGPGTNLLTISGNDSVQVFAVNAQNAVTISLLTIANGRATGYANGAGIANAGRLTISSCAFVNNQTFGGWGGAVFNSGALAITNSTFFGNQVTGESGVIPGGGGGAGMGGALFTMSGSAILSSCNLASNSATGGNGAISGGNHIGRGGGTNGGFGEFNRDGGFGGGGCGFPPYSEAGNGGFGSGGGGGGLGGAGGFGGGAGNGCNSTPGGGGGGAGLGGGIFVHSGKTTIVDCSLIGNQSVGGSGGADSCGPTRTGSAGSGFGPDFFNMTGIILPALTATTHGGGTVQVDPPTPPYLGDSLATVTATPAAGWTFLQWLGDACGTNPVISLHMDRNRFVQALFGTPLSHSESISVSPQSALYPYGTVVKLTAIPPPSNYFVSWAGNVSGTNNPMSFIVETPAPDITCEFAALSLGESSLTVVENGGGRVVVIPAKNRYAINETVGLIPIPELGQEFIGWSGDAGGAQNPLLVSMIQSKAVTANFTKRPSLRDNTSLEGIVEDGFRFTLLGEFGARYTILGSTNLADWSVAGAVTNTYGTVQFTDLVSTNLPRRFYKALEE